jgi:heterodisulfide reductase subunit A
MIQCVGCRNEDRNYCSRVCCSHSVKNALKLKAINPEMDVTIALPGYANLRLQRSYYREASDQDVRFIRWTPDDKPRVEAAKAEGRSVLRVVRDRSHSGSKSWDRRRSPGPGRRRGSFGR